MGDVKIQILKDGPLLVQGEVLLVDHDGRELEGSRKGTLALCRCGGSVSKPFCDGTHSRIGFRGAEKAVAETETG